MNLFINIAGFIIALVLIAYTYFKWSFQYWEKKGVPFLQPSFPLGNIENPLASKRCVGIVLKDMYEEFKQKGVKFGGVYALSRPSIIAIDPEFVRSVLAKDFRYVLSFF